MPSCPGLFHGEIPIPLAVDCDVVHVLLGVLCGAVRPLHVVGPVVFVLYQAVEELPAGTIIHGFVKDVVYFLVGYGVARAVVRVCCTSAVPDEDSGGGQCGGGGHG